MQTKFPQPISQSFNPYIFHLDACALRVCACVWVYLHMHSLRCLRQGLATGGQLCNMFVIASDVNVIQSVACAPPLHSRPLPPAWPPLGASLAVFALSLGARCCRPGRGHGRHRAFGDALGCGGGRRGEGDEGKKAEEAVGKEAKREVEGKAEGVC